MTTEQQDSTTDDATSQYVDTLRRQMRQQDKQRFRDPDALPVGTPPIYALYVWRRKMWLLLAFVRLAPSPARMRKWRKKYKVADLEIIRAVDLLSAAATGAGSTPRTPPTTARAGRLSRKNAQLALVATTRARTRKRATDARLTRCDHQRGRHGSRCQFRAPWYVAYTNARGQRIVRVRCGRHAWDERCLPEGAHQIVRVAREVA